MNIFSKECYKHDILEQTLEALFITKYKDTAIITSNISLLQKLAIILSKKGVTLVYKKPFIFSPVSSFIVSSLDLIIHGFKQPYLLNLLKEPLMNLHEQSAIDFIEAKVVRSIKKGSGFLGMKENVRAMPEATKLLNEIEQGLMQIKNIKSKEIKHYVYLTLSYLKNFIEITEELSLFFKIVVKNISYPVTSIKEYKNLLVYFMKHEFCINLPTEVDNIYAFEWKELPFILEPNIILVNQELPDDFINADYLQKKIIVIVNDKINEYVHTDGKNPEPHTLNYNCTFYYNPPAHARPKYLTSTMLQCLINSPYEFYLKYILKLSELATIGKKPGNLELGILLHEIFAKFSINRKITFGEVLDYSQKMLSRYSSIYSYVKNIWSKKIESAIKQFVDFHNKRILNICNIEAEKTVLATISGVIISARLDRIEYLKDDKIAIIDYKTGSIPSKSEVTNYSKAQILIQSIIVSKSINKPLTELTYLGFDNNSLTLSTPQDLQIIEKFKIFLENLLEKYINQEMPFM